MKDFNGNELVEGDFVAFLEPNFRHMIRGRVVGFTPKSIRIEYLSYYNRRSGYSIQERADVCNRLDMWLKFSLRSRQRLYNTDITTKE